MRRQAEIGLLLALCLFLPLYEAPKNLAWAGYLCVWLVNRAASRNFGGRWDLWDSLIAVWLVGGFAVAAGAALHGSEWRGALDPVRYGSVLWTLKRSRFSESELRALLATLVASAVLGLGVALLRIWLGTQQRIELNSVGHVNHSAIYLAIVLGLCASWLFAGAQRVIVGAAAAVILLGLFATESRGAVGAGLIALCALGVAWLRRSRWPALCVAGVLAAITLAATLGSAGVFEKQKAQFATGDALNFRDRVWRIAIDAWQAHPWFGVGMDNFSQLTRNEQEPYRTLYTHAHSLYFNTLAERGVIGSAPLAAILVAWLVALARARPRRGDPDQYWLLWGAAASAWIVTCVAGTVNTTLHHEHGLLAALLVGLWLGQRPSQAPRGESRGA